MSLTLRELAIPLGLSAPAIAIDAMTLDSRKVTPGTLFIAVKGHSVDGRRFIESALARGAAAVMFEADSPEQSGLDHRDHRLLGVYRLPERLSLLAGAFYGDPSAELQLVGVTGTNGKSTVTQLVANWSCLLGTQAGVMGTLGNGLYGQLQDAINTTGSALEVQQQLAEQQQAGARRLAMEVSSHGLHQHRVAALNFDVAVFTNLSRDHLDYHGTMAEYGEAKRRLFELCRKARVINADDPLGRRWLRLYPDAIAYSLHGRLNDFGGRQLVAETVHFYGDGLKVTINSDWGNGVLSAPLMGRFNVANLLAAMGTLLALGEPFDRLLATAPRLSGVAGRMEPFTAPEQPLVVVDYAHTPDALEQVLQALRQHCKGRLWCLAGCGGDRDKGKRPLMAAAAEQGADVVILTDDNPRTESAEAIIEDMRRGLSEPDAVLVIHQRAEAIRHAIEQANAEDIILVAGKGHEDYQIVGTDKMHYSDRQTVSSLLGLGA
ncbi:UDP-N-acetylmuramoyl-L-alanyl-D-glutamate--2,6-diaminopimelate ligase [Oceanisphaera psychrotolerans]|uniref:UDP-N-acetylmuramoyl-L-alanyl-D-glutamate--2,6-diaminopimelate ligase n=1 Tax=Oceanisphaera psychrotolerans TaxID=1414654 RepID=A0A1J4QED0_9GAMM|nr:UDP-N-acetylmuramoyl-L-alanyl-D-glutamate--2,6-diaminopimelate ligase [Oceanisphaera psychrotolerans]OIN09983.1 UDP-N-acetylmuramoyl-L-alanyl-D-glutamate--2,6-diaminopimelate ligase [Oceanisphaera psychrotolerans]